jgi:hypothetical protein
MQDQNAVWFIVVDSVSTPRHLEIDEELYIMYDRSTLTWPLKVSSYSQNNSCQCSLHG